MEVMLEKGKGRTYSFVQVQSDQSLVVHKTTGGVQAEDVTFSFPAASTSAVRAIVDAVVFEYTALGYTITSDSRPAVNQKRKKEEESDDEENDAVLLIESKNKLVATFCKQANQLHVHGKTYDDESKLNRAVMLYEKALSRCKDSVVKKQIQAAIVDAKAKHTNKSKRQKSSRVITKSVNHGSGNENDDDDDDDDDDDQEFMLEEEEGEEEGGEGKEECVDLIKTGVKLVDVFLAQAHQLHELGVSKLASGHAEDAESAFRRALMAYQKAVKRATSPYKQRIERLIEMATASQDQTTATTKKAKAKPKVAGNGVFSGMQFCMSGALSQTRKKMSQLLLQHGGVFHNSVSGKTDVLVTTQSEVSCNNGEGTVKCQKAEQLGKPMVEEQWLHACIEAGRRLPYASYRIGGGGGGGGGSDSSSEEEEEEKEKEEEENVIFMTDGTNSVTLHLDRVHNEISVDGKKIQCTNAAMAQRRYANIQEQYKKKGYL